MTGTSFPAAAALAIFCVSCAATATLVLLPLSVPLPTRLQRALRTSTDHRVTVSYAWAPVLGTLAMLATGALDGAGVAAGILGDAVLQPYAIVVLFMSLAYMSASLDMTGLFQWVALRLACASRGNGLALFLLLYCLSSVLTIFTSNDLVVMTLTPIIYYFSVATACDPIPFLVAQFSAANIWSMLLFVGNPTNIIVASALQMTFAGYSKWMALPTLVAGVLALCVVLLLHARHIPQRLSLPDLQPSAMLVDAPGAVFGSTNILVCLGVLAAAPSLHWPLYQVTLVCAGLAMAYNFAAYVLFKGAWCRTTSSRVAAMELGAAAPAAPASSDGSMVVPSSASDAIVAITELRHRPCQHKAAAAGGKLELSQQPEAAAGAAGTASVPVHISHTDAAAAALSDGSSKGRARASLQGEKVSVQEVGLSLVASSSACSCQQLLTAPQQQAGSDALSERAAAAEAGAAQGQAYCPVCHHASSPGGAGSAVAAAAAAASCGLAPQTPSFWRALLGLPWEVVPFVLSMFCLVEGLNRNGWVESLARWLGGVLAGGAVWGTLFGVGLLSVLVCCLVNNQPATILLTRVIMSPAFAAVSGPTGPAAAFAVVVASNTSANFSVMGALAGLLFVRILQARGCHSITYARFSLLLAPAGLVSTLGALTVLALEFGAWNF